MNNGPPSSRVKVDEASPLFGLRGYLDLYVLGSTPAPGGPPRHQVQILNKYDSCCFKGAKAEGTYAEALGAFVAQAGGEYHMAIDATHAGHLISECALRAFVLPALDR